MPRCSMISCKLLIIVFRETTGGTKRISDPLRLKSYSLLPGSSSLVCEDGKELEIHDAFQELSYCLHRRFRLDFVFDG